MYSDLSTLENCIYYNSIQNTNILGGVVESFLTSKLSLFTFRFFFKFSPNNLNIATELALPWSYEAITKMKY